VSTLFKLTFAIVLKGPADGKHLGAKAQRAAMAAALPALDEAVRPHGYELVTGRPAIHVEQVFYPFVNELVMRKTHLPAETATDPYLTACGCHARKKFLTTDRSKVDCKLCLRLIE
jgi:hypothetical protein